MDILIVTLFVSLVLVVVGVVFFVVRLREGDLEHGERLSLLPLEEEEDSPPAADSPANGQVLPK
jgi:hypothetical protein